MVMAKLLVLEIMKVEEAVFGLDACEMSDRSYNFMSGFILANDPCHVKQVKDPNLPLV